MKLVRFGPPMEERPGVWIEEALGPGRPGLLDVRAMAFDIEDYDAHFFSRWGLDRLHGLLAEKKRVVLPAEGRRLGPPVARPGKIICLGNNYADHVSEFDAKRPDRPILFAKAATALIGPFDAIRVPADAEVDVEVELAAVIGQAARHVPESEAMACVAGYTVLDDVTDRKAQRANGQWFRAKSRDTFCPLGPFLVTTDEVPDPYALRLHSKIRGQVIQDARASDMIFKIAHLIAYASAAMTLEPGDVLSTGTPGGIGSARTPPLLLRPGDEVEVGVEGIGVQRNRVEPA
ncbi:MAG: fumarylacetoacetate hydrolase family protein [Verrucomicrobia bacterium]|nr:fumarylacetoacetate hydrolase family protein [Verrucomicrobiota bacterium]